jgi:hypothetical protein
MSDSNSPSEVSSEKVGYQERFDQERTDWTKLIREISARFKNVEEMVDVQVDLYSQRQVAVDYMHQLITLQAKLKKSHLTDWKKAYDALSMNEDFRYNDREKAKFADEKTSLLKLKIDILQTHIDFFRETIKTLDNMIFGVKHRIDIEDFRRGNK